MLLTEPLGHVCFFSPYSPWKMDLCLSPPFRLYVFPLMPIPHQGEFSVWRAFVLVCVLSSFPDITQNAPYLLEESISTKAPSGDRTMQNYCGQQAEQQADWSWAGGSSSWANFHSEEHYGLVTFHRLHVLEIPSPDVDAIWKYIIRRQTE